MSAQTRQFCTFRVDSLLLGVDVQEVQEVIRFQAMTRVPLASRAVSGLINLRGQIVIAIDLRVQLELPDRDPSLRPMNVVVRDDEEVVSLLVDEIGDVVEVSDELFEPPPSTISASARALIDGAFKLPDELLLVLNTRKALTEIRAPALAEA
jgi:purine-binding chemotaxis protein CheW